MGLGVSNGAVTYCSDLDAVAAYIGREPVTLAQIWGFERWELAQLAVTTRTKHASIVVRASASGLRDMVGGFGWPEVLLHGRHLPHEAGALYHATLPLPPDPPQELVAVRRRRVRPAPPRSTPPPQEL